MNTDIRKDSDEAGFLSPAETQGMLSALEERDARMLGSSKTVVDFTEGDEEGFFVSPGELGEDGIEIGIPAPTSKPGKPAASAPSVQSDILTRIAGELRSIKSELGSLKANYDEMLVNSEPREAPESVQDPVARQELPEGLQDDLKRLLVYLDRLLESLPESKIDEFAGSEYFDLYRKVFSYFDLS